MAQSNFFVKDGFLYRSFYSKSSGQTTMQLVVPRQLRDSVLLATHCSVFAGRMAAGSTTKRLLPYFFWPGVKRDVKHYCASCDICQRTFLKSRVPSALLQQMPVIESPI